MSNTDTRGVKGYCPMGCGSTLFLDRNGHVCCSVVGCPNPTAVDDILSEYETEHVVEIRATDFTIRHPLRERINDDLMTCALGAHLNALDGPPAQPGRYRAHYNGERWIWLALGGVA